MNEARTLCAQYNQRRSRSDVVWFLSDAGELMLRDCPDWQAQHTKRLAERAESDRRQFNHRQKFPVQEAADQ